jgi:hypothetical protein
MAQVADWCQIHHKEWIHLVTEFAQRVSDCAVCNAEEVWQHFIGHKEDSGL